MKNYFVAHKKIHSIPFGKFNSCLVNLHGVYYFYGFFLQLNQATTPLQLYRTA